MTTEPPVKDRYLRVIQMSDRTEVHKVLVSPSRYGIYERILRGMLINLNRDEYLIDDSDFDDLTAT